MERIKSTKVVKTTKPSISFKEDKSMKLYEKLQKAISNMKADQVEAEISRIQAEKAKRYEYHKKYNQIKKAYETELVEKAKKLNLIK